MRDVSEAKRREFYDVMLEDTNRLTNTVEQVLQASALNACVLRSSLIYGAETPYQGSFLQWMLKMLDVMA